MIVSGPFVDGGVLIVGVQMGYCPLKRSPPIGGPAFGTLSYFREDPASGDV